MRTVEFEVVDYRTDEMDHASRELIDDFTKYSRLERVQRSKDVFGAIHDVLKKRNRIR